MKKEDRKMILQLFEQVAEERGITVFEVRNRIAEAIRFGRSSPDPDIQKIWAKIPFEGEEPTPEELMYYFIQRMPYYPTFS
jgi:hypothetical protein